MSKKRDQKRQRMTKPVAVTPPAIRRRSDGREYGMGGGLGVPSDICEPTHPWFAAIAEGWEGEIAAYRSAVIEPTLARVAQAVGSKTRPRELRLIDEDHEQRTGRQGVIRPTREREEKGDVELVKDMVVGKNERVTGFRAASACPLVRMAKRKEISQWQAAAGLRLCSQWQKSGGQEPRMTARYEEPTDKGVREATKAELDARRRYIAAMQAVGTILSPVLVHVVLLERSAESWAIERGHTGRQAGIVGMTTLRLALDQLAEHYRMQKTLDAAYGHVA